jgi:ABC-type glutathione transport system ATPase component
MAVDMTGGSSDADTISAEYYSIVGQPLKTEGSFSRGVGQKDDQWHSKHKVEEIRAREVRSEVKARDLGMTWKNINVEVTNAEAAVNENMVSQFNLAKLIKEARHKPQLKKKKIDDRHGCVKPGEMLLVLGRPRSGCTTLLNMIANRRRGYASVTEDAWYGSMPASEASRYRGQIVMNTEEEDLFFPTLTVSQTMGFAT